MSVWFCVAQHSNRTDMSVCPTNNWLRPRTWNAKVCPLALNYILGHARAYDLEFRSSMRRFLPGGLLLLATAILVSTMTYQDAFSLDRVQARSMVISQSGIVASESPLASQAGAPVLARGGNAVDAAIPAHPVMTVVAPECNGLGCDRVAISHVSH